MSRAGGAVSGSAQCHTAFQHDAVCPGGRADNAWVLPGGQPQQQVQTGRLALRPYPWQVCAERGEQTVAAGPGDEVHPPQVAGEAAAVDEAGQGQLPERLGVVVVLDHQRTGLARPFEQLYPRSADSTAPLG